MRSALLAPLLLAAAACGGAPKTGPSLKPTAAGPVAKRISTAATREKVSVTVYNAGFGLVRETRSVDVGEGRVSLEYRDVAAHVQPETVHVKSLDGDSALTVFEQNYRYDLLTPAKLLEKYVGKKVRIFRWNESLGAEEPFDAEVLSVSGGRPVFRIGGEVTYGFPGRLSFPEVPANLIANPTLVWLLSSAKAKQRLEVTYLTSEMKWRSDYVLVVDAADAMGDLTGWVTLDNRSGTSFENAQLKLVAGDVNKLPQANEYDGDEDFDGIADKKDEAFTEESFFEYHLYTLGRPTTLLTHEQKQVTLLEAKAIKLQKKLVFTGAAHWYRSKYGQLASNQKVSVFLELANAQQNGLGMPLPKGVVRVYKNDASGARQFIGEDSIDHTPRDETVRIKMGEAFDVVGDRKQTSWKPLGTCGSESDWEISLRNHKDVPAQIEVVEPIGGDWTIVQSSHPSVKKDAHTFTFDVAVPKNGAVKITYRVRVKWC